MKRLVLNWNPIALVLLASALLASVVCPGEVVAAEPTFKVMTYNIRYLNTRDGQDVWEHRQDTVAATIAGSDLVGLQEVVGQQLDDIRNATPKLEWYGVGRDDGQHKGEMTAIGWRKSRFEALERGTFWLSDTPDTVGSKGWDAALPRIASWVRLQDRETQKQYLFVNTHFDHMGREARTNSAKLLRRWIAENRQELPTILTGDLNAESTDAPLKALLEADATEAPPLRDARQASPTPDSGPNSTWNGFREIVDGRRIDFVLLAGELEVVQVTTLDPKTKSGRFASDHLPVVAELR